VVLPEVPFMPDRIPILEYSLLEPAIPPLSVQDSEELPDSASHLIPEQVLAPSLPLLDLEDLAEQVQPLPDPSDPGSILEILTQHLLLSILLLSVTRAEEPLEVEEA